MKQGAIVAKKRGILLVDDEGTTLKLYKKVLADEGHPVVAVKTGEEALQKINEESFAMVILDLNLPDMGGMELLKKMKDKIQETPVVIVTGHPSLESSVEAIRTGRVYDYVLKPFEPEDLKLSVARALEKSELLVKNKWLMKRLETANAALLERVEQLENFSELAKEYEEKISSLEKKLKVLKGKTKK